MSMGKISKDGSKSNSNQLFKDKAKNRVDELLGMLKDLPFDEKTGDRDVIKERMNHMLNEWKAELNEPSPASSQNDGSLGSFSSDLIRILVDDDVTSELTFPINSSPVPDTNTQCIQVGDNCYLHEIQDYFVNQGSSGQELHADNQFRDSFSGQHTIANTADIYSQFDYGQYNMHHEADQNLFSDSGRTSPYIESVSDQVSSVMCTLDPLSSFLATKCALWDCVRPAKGLGDFQDYCDQLHVDLAKKEGPPGSTPVMQRGGIGLNDDVLFAALIAKTQGKDVGIPECAGAATAKSPWNAPELFNLVLEGERVREWLFFDKPRRGSESKDKNRRSLPDYSGRGWHMSRTLKMAEYDGSKKIYYMDPQPLSNLELHLSVYEINNCNGCALYRMELKLDEKKSPKGKTSDKSPVDLQKQIGKFPADDSPSFAGDRNYITDTGYELKAQNQRITSDASFFYGDSFLNLSPHEDGSPSFDGLVNNLEVSNQHDYSQFDFHESVESNFIIAECALWDCSRPAQGSHYCSMFHSNIAFSEGSLSMNPVLRPRGLSLKDGPLFASLGAKLLGKEVGIPECEGAATMKSPWNDPERFNTYLFEGEIIREWLFFDKPRKAFESGNRNKRSLPDYSGRGWHSSRKQEMKEYGGVKKTYYMDPQPSKIVEWHLYEYLSDSSDALILYRLALTKGKKKSPKGKSAKDPIVDLQNQMDRLNAEFPSDNEEATADSKYNYQVQNQHGTSFS